MCPFPMEMDGRRCFIRSTVRLGHVEKWPLLMDWRKGFRTGLNIVAWYHCSRSGLVVSARALSAAGHGMIGGWSRFLGMLNLHMPYMFERVPSNTVR